MGNNSLGERIKLAASIKDGMKGIKGLAQEIDVPRSTFQGWLADTTEPKASQILAICKATGVSPVWLLTGEDPAQDAKIANAADSTNHFDADRSALVDTNFSLINTRLQAVEHELTRLNTGQSDEIAALQEAVRKLNARYEGQDHILMAHDAILKKHYYRYRRPPVPDSHRPLTKEKEKQINREADWWVFKVLGSAILFMFLVVAFFAWAVKDGEKNEPEVVLGSFLNSTCLDKMAVNDGFKAIGSAERHPVPDVCTYAKVQS